METNIYHNVMADISTEFNKLTSGLPVSDALRLPQYPITIPRQHGESKGSNILTNYIANNVYPMAHEDHAFLSSIWSEIEGSYRNSLLYESDFGRDVYRLLSGKIRLGEFLRRHPNGMYKARMMIYNELNRLGSLRNSMSEEDYLQHVVNVNNFRDIQADLGNLISTSKNSSNLSNFNAKDNFVPADVMNADSLSFSSVPIAGSSPIFDSSDLLTNSVPESRSFGFPFVHPRPRELLERFDIFYSDLGFTTEYGFTVRKDSPLMRARLGEIPLTPAMFNIGIFPSLIDRSEDLAGKHTRSLSNPMKNLGWTKSQLIEAIRGLEPNPVKSQVIVNSNNYSGNNTNNINSQVIVNGNNYNGNNSNNINSQEKINLDRLNRIGLILVYRRLFGSDGYIDWNIVKKYHTLKNKNIQRISRIFGMNRDQYNVSYDNLADLLQRISIEKLNIRNQAISLVNSASEDGVSGWNKILAKCQACWIIDVDGKTKLFYNGYPIIDELIPKSFEDYMWACNNSDEVEIFYLVYFAQKLGIWNLIESKEGALTPEIICNYINQLIAILKEKSTR